MESARMCDQEQGAKLLLKERVDILAALLDRVDGWLRYAENKNGTLLALSLAAVGLALRTGNSSASHFSVSMYWIGIVFCLIAIIPLIATSWPTLDRMMPKRAKNAGAPSKPHFNDSPNPIFFDDIASMSKLALSEKLSERLGKPKKELSLLEINFIDQIYINSIIAHHKFQAFAPAVKFFVIGVILIMFGLFLE